VTALDSVGVFDGVVSVAMARKQQIVRSGQQDTQDRSGLPSARNRRHRLRSRSRKRMRRSR
jgi:hypothetical protein